MIGNIFNRWIVLSEAKTNKTRRYFECKCECGIIQIVESYALRTGEVKMCKECLFSTKYDTNTEIGKKYGKWTVLVRVKNNKAGRYYECKCECGNVRDLQGVMLRAGRSTQCTDCQYRDLYNPVKEIGKKYGKWTIIRYVDVHRNLHRFECECQCGFKRLQLAAELRGGKSTQCITCHNKENATKNTTHGMHTMPLYRVWATMLSRCKNPNSKYYHRYGGRGISVCDKWLKFDGFLEDMGYRPDNMTIERIDNHGGYNKENCKWVTHKENCQNRTYPQFQKKRIEP